jgi:NAD(P)-dependent dehydrogenase (short-subunit alcohol dehydrogenase family)
MFPPVIWPGDGRVGNVPTLAGGRGHDIPDEGRGAVIVAVNAVAARTAVDARLSEHIPLRRYGEPGEFGRAAAFVLSPAASYITGAMIPVDGGAISSI